MLFCDLAPGAGKFSLISSVNFHSYARTPSTTPLSDSLFGSKLKTENDRLIDSIII